MRIVIGGGHGKIALRLTRLLSPEHTVVGIVRNSAHPPEVAAAGGEGVVCDLEKASQDEAERLLRGADAVVFAAGAGPGSGAARKETVDLGAAVLLARAAERAGVRRFVQVAAMGLERLDDADVDPVFAAYLRAKIAAEEDLRGRDLAWTILRPGGLTDDPGTGRVRLAESLPFDKVSRDDVASVLAELCLSPVAVHRTLELVTGDTPIPEAVAAVDAPPRR